MFEEFKVWGPYTIISGTVKRRRVVLQDKKNYRKKTSMNYARYLMCLKENRLLSSDEEVDHIDENPLNDSIDNLQILSKPENHKKHYKKS